MNRRARILVGMAAGALWALAVVWAGQGIKGPFLPLNVALMLAFLPGGLVLLVLIGRLAQRRFFDDTLINGAPPETGSAFDLDQRVLSNTVEQLILALCLWPFVALNLGGICVVVMGVAFALARLAFWIGYRWSPLLRAFGFAATFYSTILAVIWSLLVWIV